MNTHANGSAPSGTGPFVSRYEIRDRSDNHIVTLHSQVELLRLLKLFRGKMAGDELAVIVYDGGGVPARYLMSEVLR